MTKSDELIDGLVQKHSLGELINAQYLLALLVYIDPASVTAMRSWYERLKTAGLTSAEDRRIARDLDEFIKITQHGLIVPEASEPKATPGRTEEVLNYWEVESPVP